MVKDFLSEPAVHSQDSTEKATTALNRVKPGTQAKEAIAELHKFEKSKSPLSTADGKYQ